MMSRGAAGHSVLVMSASWQHDGTELSFVTRALAGAASRVAPVTIVTPTPPGPTVADGAFDLRGIGTGLDGSWPDGETTAWVRSPPDRGTRWLIDDPTPAAMLLFEAFGEGAAHSVKEPGRAMSSEVTPLPLLPQGESTVGLYVPVNPSAASHRHAGLGFTGYLLVLSDRSSAPAVDPPPPVVAWLTAMFHRQYVVVIENGAAAVWKGRALRGVVSVDTRMDLWRLMAHAWLTVDIGPGAVIARECVESLRFGTPIVVPEDVSQPAAAHALAGGGLTFSDPLELREVVEQLLGPSERERYSRAGASYADALYGDPTAFINRVASTFDLS